MDNWNHFLNCNVEINIEETGDFPTKYIAGFFNVIQNSIYIETNKIDHFSKDVDKSVFVAVVEINEPNIQKLFELELFLGYSFENFGIVKNETFFQLNNCLKQIELKKNLEQDLNQTPNKKSIKKI
jgi:hypothetical protein